MAAMRLLFVLAILSAGFVPAPPFYADKVRLLVYQDDAGKEKPIRTAAEWAKRREHILASMELVMGPLPRRIPSLPLDVQILEEEKTPRYVRKKLSFVAEEGDRVPAYLLVPLAAKPPWPAVLCLHETNGKLGKGSPVGLGGRPSLHYGTHLAERGYVVLAPDYPSFGEYPYEFGKRGYASGSMKAIWNNLRAIDLLQSLPEVDPDRIGCIGHSLGGHNALFTCVFEPRIKAVVSNCGFTRFARYYGGNLKGWTSARYMPRIADVYEMKPERMPFDFTEVLAAIAPRACLAIAPLHDDNFEVEGVRETIAAARPVYELLGAGEKLAAIYPDCKHDFVPEARDRAYQWLDRWLK